MKLGFLLGAGALGALALFAFSGESHAAPAAGAGPVPPLPKPPEGSDPRSKGPIASDPAAAQIASAASAAAAKIAAGEVPGVPPAVQPGKTPRQVAAEELLSHLRALGKKDKPSKAVVKSYQVEAHAAKREGLYGPETALLLAQDTGSTPPEPRAWPAGVPIEVSRKEYLRKLTQIVTVAHA